MPVFDQGGGEQQSLALGQSKWTEPARTSRQIVGMRFGAFVASGQGFDAQIARLHSVPGEQMQWGPHADCCLYELYYFTATDKNM